MMSRRALTLIAFLVPATALASVSVETATILGLMSDGLGFRDGSIRGSDAAGGTYALALPGPTGGPVVWTPSASYDEVDLEWCLEDANGGLSSCNDWDSLAPVPWEDSSGCIYGICWCEGSTCDQWLYTCPPEYYDLNCTEEIDFCTCIEK